MFFFTQYTPEHVFYDILERKDAFLGYKNKKSINSEKLTLFQRG